MNYNFCINDFEGPLDLLLHLVKESKMDIYEINISTIIEQYLEFIHSLNDEAKEQFNFCAKNLEHLHQYNLHKYMGASPAIHFDLWDSSVKGGWEGYFDKFQKIMKD